MNHLKNLTHSSISKDYSTKIKRLEGCHTIMELARSRIFQLNSRKDGVFCIIANRFGDKLKKCDEPFNDLELAMLLLASAERVAENDYACARKLLTLCNNSCLTHGTPMQRIVYYFAESLTEKINETFGSASSRMLDWIKRVPMDVRQTQISLEPSMIESHQESSSVVTEFAAIQCILENIERSNTVHLIDFGIKNGSHWIVLMQALAVRCISPINFLKITAIGTSKQLLEEIGKWLSSYAATLDLCFSYNIVLAELAEVKEDQFALEDDETLVVYLPRCLSSLLAWPHKIESFIGMIKELNPCVMVVLEVEATINSPIFLERFNEALVFFGAIFDCICFRFENDSSRRRLTEALFLRQMIQNIITKDGTDIIFRYETISFWRLLFARFHLVESVLSPSALSQASTLLKMTNSDNIFTLFMDGECLIVGYNDIPLQSVSSWKFSKQ